MYKVVDWYNEYNDIIVDTLQEAKSIFHKWVRKEPTGRFSIYDLSVDEGIIFSPYYDNER